ncbi:unnamed protein product [Arabidopsis lyrata]|nr:unnamed protein product [Arabidopsis lyrata]
MVGEENNQKKRHYQHSHRVPMEHQYLKMRVCRTGDSENTTKTKFTALVLDATSNESWGPNGSLLVDIAYAWRYHHEYELTMETS